MPEILTNINCEPGSEECPLSCNNRVATTTSFDEPYRSYDACHFGGEEIVNNKRTPSCISAESKARELREENERLWANLLNLTTGVLYLYNKATGAYNPKRLYVSKEALRSLYELATKMHEESTNG